VEDYTPVITIREVVAALARRWRLIVAVHLVILLSTAVFAFLEAPQYRASTRILFTADRAQISTSSEKTTELVRTSAVPETEMNSQVQILRSRDLVEEVLRSLGVQPSKETSQSFVSWLTDLPREILRVPYRKFHKLDDVEISSPLYWESLKALDSIEVTRFTGSNLVELAFTSTNPTWARDFVNRLAGAYVERYAHLRGIQEAEDFFTKQSEILKQKLTDSEAQLQRLRERAGALTGQESEIQARLAEFSGELARVKIARAEQERRMNYLAGHAPASGRVGVPELVALEARRAELLGRYKVESERVRDIDAQIQRLRGALSTYGASAAGAVGTSPETDILSGRASLVALQAREQALTVAEAEYRRQAEQLDSQSFDLARIERQVKIDEEAYLSYVRTAEQSRLSNALEASKLMRLTIVEPAAMPIQPVNPNRRRIFNFAVLGGLVIAALVALARDFLDPTVKSAADVRRSVGLEVLAAVPERS
jgi:uncharacterized protein involved in exopolysaccharide biosynthesis